VTPRSQRTSASSYSPPRSTPSGRNGRSIIGRSSSTSSPRSRSSSASRAR
jgi:hypothetical protein